MVHPFSGSISLPNCFSLAFSSRIAFFCDKDPKYLPPENFLVYAKQKQLTLITLTKESIESLLCAINKSHIQVQESIIYLPRIFGMIPSDGYAIYFLVHTYRLMIDELGHSVIP